MSSNDADLCTCGHPRADHNEFTSPGCYYPTCQCMKFEPKQEKRPENITKMASTPVIQVPYDPGVLTVASYKMKQDLNEHIEEYAAAYIKLVNLPPDQVVMKVKQEIVGHSYVQTIWFEKKSDQECV